MAKEFKLPDLGEGLSEATLVGWKVKEGDVVSSDQVLAEVETDKALSELPSPFGGRIVKLHWKAGATVPVGATLVTFEAGEQAAKPNAAGPAKAKTDGQARRESAPAPSAATATAAPAVTKSSAPPAESPPTGRRPVLAAPATRKLAREHGVGIEKVPGTGPGGRVTPEDVLAFASSPARHQKEAIVGESFEADRSTTIPRPMLPDFSQWGEVERQPASAIRRRIAQRMMLSVQSAASVTHSDEADITELEDNRKQARAIAEKKGFKLTLLPYVIKAVVAALKRRPVFNASYDQDKQEIVLKKYFHIGVAVDSPQGLLVPVVRNADKKTIAELAKDIVELAEKARDGKLSADQMRGGSFTITNVGAIGGTGFTPIINWPEVAILGLARLQERPALKSGAWVPRKIMPLCLTFDHRMMDGAEAARFVNDIKQFLENPLLMLLEN